VSGAQLLARVTPVFPYLGSRPGSIPSMKVSVSLPGEDVEFLDAYAEAHAFPSRSAVVQQAIRMLRLGELGDAYGPAWEEWANSGEEGLWEQAVGDGL
jgi:hypothetical protein